MLGIILTHKANFSDQNDNSKICSLSTITQDEIFQFFFFFLIQYLQWGMRT